ncbi:MAG: hypothetical protein WCX28_03270 [Bacteriovoracaceae bacterium]|nr:hypothetical protein [Bacteroidota bacterium]
MQKIITILLVFVYLTLSAGLNIIVHTCGGESEMMLATTNVEDPCGCGDEMAADQCCTTEVTTVKLADDQKTNIITIDQQLSVCAVVLPCESMNTQSDEPNVSTLYHLFFSPPPKNDLCIVNSVFLI